jgi:outer membrane protein
VQERRNQEFLRLAEARFQVGQATQLDVRQAQVALGQSQVALLQARQAVTVAILRLFEQIGIAAPDDPTVVQLPDTFPIVDPVWTLPDLLAEADRSNPDVEAFDAQARAARWNARATRSQWLPTVNVSAGWSGFTQQFTNTAPLVDNAIAEAQARAAADQLECSYANANWLNNPAAALPCDDLALTPGAEDAIRSQIAARNSVFPFDFTSQPFSASITLSLPLFTQFTRPQAVSQAQAQAEDAVYAADARRLQLRTLVSEAFYGLRTAFQTIGIQQTNREAADEQLRLATERYRVGSGTFFELLDAQLAAQRAEADYINALYAYHRAVAALEAAVGRPLR